MPPRRRARKSNRPLRRRRVNRRRNPQQTSGMIRTKQYARCVEVVPFTAPTPNIDVNYQFNISQFDRALAISKNFKFYRAKRVSWSMLPEYTTFQASTGATANQSIPQVSMIMNRTGDNSAWGLAEYDAQGAVPFAFNKKKVIAYKPNLVQPFNVTLGGLSPQNPPVATTATLGNTPVYDKWIGTGSYGIDALTAGPLDIIIRGDLTPYYGHSIYWSVSSVVTNNTLATIFCEVEWEFKDPLFANTEQTALNANIAMPVKNEVPAPE